MGQVHNLLPRLQHKLRQAEIERRYRQDAGIEPLDQPDMDPGKQFYRCGCDCVTFWVMPQGIVCTECSAEIER